MALITLACLAALGAWDGANSAPTPPASTSSVVADFERLRDESGRGAPDHVRLALWCEAHGLAAERLRQLALAMLADPAYLPARGLAGLVWNNGRWIAPDLLARSHQDDPARAKLLASYDARRSTAPYTAHGQWSLALWAEAHGLPDQAKAHFITVTRLDPSREAAWKRLGFRKHHGGWATEAQIAAEKAEAEAQRLADHHWRPLLEHSRQRLRHSSHQDEAFQTLGRITDPRAVPSVVHVFGGTDEGDQQVALLVLGRIASPLSSLCIAHLAVASGSPTVRSDALGQLADRDVRDFVDPLIRLIRTPLNVKVRPVTGPGMVGELLVEGESYNLYALVRSPVLNTSARDMAAGNPFPFQPDLDARDAVLRAGSAPTPGDPRSVLPGNDLQALQRRLDAGKLVQLDRINAQIAERALEARAGQARAANAEIAFSNDRILTVLTALTGQKYGADRRAWSRWSTDHAGYASQTTEATDKPTITEEIAVAYQTELPPTSPPSRSAPQFRRHAACFAAGTLVRTLDGTRLIELIRPGDQVLVQDGRTGALSYQAVIKAFHNPPNATLRIRVGDDEVVATGIHRFWRAGEGWTMARDLKVGDLLRVLGGTAAVAAIEPDQTQPVFNLEVAEGRSFFVGSLGALVHDNTLVEATPEPFDAPRPIPTKTVASTP